MRTDANRTTVECIQLDAEQALVDNKDRPEIAADLRVLISECNEALSHVRGGHLDINRANPAFVASTRFEKKHPGVLPDIRRHQARLGLAPDVQRV